MKNMKVAMKLIVSFLIVAALAAVVGIFGIFGLLQMSNIAADMYEEQTVPLAYISAITTQQQRLRVGMREYAIAVASDNAEKIETSYTTIQSIITEIDKNFDLYAPTITSEEALKLFNEARATFDGPYQDYLSQCYTAAKAGDLQTLLDILNTAITDVNLIINNLDKCMEIKTATASDANDVTTSLSFTLLLLIIIILVVAVAISLFLAFYISGIISKPLLVLTAFMKKAGSTGDISLTKNDYDVIGKYGQSKDEIGQCINSTASFISHMIQVGEELETIADGDLSADIKLLSENDTMGNSLKKMSDNLNSMFSEINASTAQVASGSKQIADGAQALAQGSTEQAAAVQQLSSSISEIAHKTKTNSEMADKAAKLGDIIKGNADKGSRQMDEMMSAVKEINQASQSISKVIKVIDDIAFQTNILALNAAVEAARAGQHGKGFAVVSEEVRNLAAKSAEAAKDTGSLIANSIEKAELGARIADETAASLIDIVSGINESSQLVSQIAKSSEDQSAGISQVNTGIDQVAQVVQQNSATAQESAAASEEMSGQSYMLEELISRFKLKGSASPYANLPKQDLHQLPESKTNRSAHLPGSNGGSFGKY